MNRAITFYEFIEAQLSTDIPDAAEAAQVSPQANQTSPSRMRRGFLAVTGTLFNPTTLVSRQ